MAVLLIVVSGLSERRTALRTRNVHVVPEDFEHRPTKQSNRGTNYRELPQNKIVTEVATVKSYRSAPVQLAG